MATESKITRNLCKIFIDVSNGSGTPDWKQIDKSTLLDIAMNPETETQDYISMEMPVEEIKSYKPSMEQEIATFKNNPIYEFMFEKFFATKTLQVKSLICFPPHGEPEKMEAWMVPITTCVLNNMNYADGKLSWTMNFGGNTERGTYTIDENTGAPTFTKVS